MKIRHEVCMVLGLLLFLGSVADAKTVIHKRVVDCKSKTSAACTEDILVALGHPLIKFQTDGSQGDVVHGALREVRFCDVRTVGENIQWHDGKWRVLTHENMVAYFTGQGHQIMKVEADKYYCDTIIQIEIYEQDDPPNNRRKSYKKPPLVMPSDEEMHTKLDNLVIP